MKLKLLLSAIFFCSYISAQDWNPVRVGETRYYFDKTGLDQENLVSAARIDSIKYLPNITVYRFHSKPESAMYTNCYYRSTGAIWLGKKMIQTASGDFAFIRTYPLMFGDSRSPYWSTCIIPRDTLYFYINKPKDSSWIMCQDTLGNKIVATMLASAYGTHAGISDSVKFIKIEKWDVNNLPVNDAFFSTDTFILSKNNGFIKAFDLNELPERKNVMIQFQHQGLTYKDVYGFDVGDLFHYRSQYPYKTSNDYILEKVSSQTDSVTYKIRRVTESQLTVYPYNKHISDDTVFETYPYTNALIHPNALPEESFTIHWYQNVKKLVTYHAGLHKDIWTETFYDNDFGRFSNIADSACFTHSIEPDQRQKYYMKGCGYYFHHAYQSGISGYDASFKELIYYKKGSQVWGNPKFLNVNQNSAQLHLSVYPNPASSILKIEIPDKHAKDINYRLIDITGRTLSSGHLDENRQLNLRDLNIAPGIYFLNISTEGKSGTIKVSIE